MGEGIGKFIISLIIVSVISILLSIVFGISFIFNSSKEIILESKTKLEPDYRLEANGKVVDTVWVYKLKTE